MRRWAGADSGPVGAEAVGVNQHATRGGDGIAFVGISLTVK